MQESSFNISHAGDFGKRTQMCVRHKQLMEACQLSCLVKNSSSVSWPNHFVQLLWTLWNLSASTTSTFMKPYVCNNNTWYLQAVSLLFVKSPLQISIKQTEKSLRNHHETVVIMCQCHHKESNIVFPAWIQEGGPIAPLLTHNHVPSQMKPNALCKHSRVGLLM